MINFSLVENPRMSADAKKSIKSTFWAEFCMVHTWDLGVQKCYNEKIL